MAPTGEQALSRVAPRDATMIAYWTSGEGPPLLLVHGTYLQRWTRPESRGNRPSGS